MEKNLDTVRQVLAQVNQVILGKREEIREVILAFLANGHVLLEDIPGVGKTTLALAFSRTMLLDYKRIQFTPDVLPSDLTGFSIYRREEEKFVYQPGSVFCNLLLADETKDPVCSFRGYGGEKGDSRRSYQRSARPLSGHCDPESFRKLWNSISSGGPGGQIYGKFIYRLSGF